VLVLLGIAFLAGFITAISPCVLPMLPIILSSSATSGSRSRPFAIVAGLVLSFTVFTLAGAALLSALGLPEDLLRDVAIAMLLLLAAGLISKRAARIVERPFLFLSRRRPAADANGLLLGISLGLVFVPCAGPILAAVTVLAATGDVGARAVLVTAAYAAGAALPMLAIAIGTQRLSSGIRVLRAHAQTLRQVAGVVLGATALAIAFGVDQRFTTAVPGYTEALQKRIERTSTAQRKLRELTGAGDAHAPSDDSPNATPAPEFRGIERWFNTPSGKPVSLESLRGSVVVVDFWTYSCINCLRTLPHLKAWDRAYRSSGLTIIGIHSPEFAFERVPDNVRSAVRSLGLHYPIGLDNDFHTWIAYSNSFWPAKYLIDRAGRIRYTHFGEGAYDETESWIRMLLGEEASAESAPVADETPQEATTPESYLGYERLDRFVGPVTVEAEARYSFPTFSLAPDELAYAGRWTVSKQHIVAGENARLRLHFRAHDIFLVLAGEGRVDVFVNGRRMSRTVVSETPGLYNIARFPQFKQGLLELRFSPGLEAYAFTFG
jgi:cytochrome c biogenesis protein CcdA/thiol-disulfide isomerase/thioredoxin